MTHEPVVKPNRSTCARGRLLPELYLLGAMHGATTSLSVDLRSKGAVAAPRDRVKEWHFFRNSAGQMFLLEQREQWLKELPPCPRERTVMVDFSDSNLFTVPLPSDLRWSSTVGYIARVDTDCTRWNTPKGIHYFYNTLGAQQPKMMAVFRDPLERIHSEWYFHKVAYHPCKGCDAGRTFADSFSYSVSLLQKDLPEVADWFWKSFYARQVEAYLKVFNPEAFVFLPMHVYTDGAFEFSAALLSHLDIDSQPWSEASHVNNSEKSNNAGNTISKRTLDEDLPPGTPARVVFESIMGREVKRLAGALARAQLGGAWLAGYEGLPGNPEQVWEWLVHQW